MATADVIRMLLMVDIIVLTLLALVYLWQRRLSRVQLLGWSAVALVPFIGAFVVIASRPGEWNEEFSIRGEVQRLSSYLQRLLPTPPKTTRATRMRKRRQQRKT
jgi:hypothetical protein